MRGPVRRTWIVVFFSLEKTFFKLIEKVSKSIQKVSKKYATTTIHIVVLNSCMQHTHGVHDVITDTTSLRRMCSLCMKTYV